MFGNITRGGQTLLHRMRMFRQVAKVSVITSSLLGVLVASVFLYQKSSYQEWHSLITYIEAKVNLAMPFVDDKLAVQDYVLPNGKNMQVKSKDIIDSEIIAQDIYHIVRIIKLGMILLLSIMTSIMLLMFSGWSWWGRDQNKNEHERGVLLVSPKNLIKLLRKQKQGSDLKIANVPIIKGSETSHMLLTGTTGVGKTNAINQLVEQIRNKKQKAIIVDVVGNYVKSFYRPGRDIILNPFDVRCEPWHFWAEIKEDPHYNEVANSIIQGAGQYAFDKFWVQSAQAIFAEILKKMHKENDLSNKNLVKYLFQAKLSELEEYLKDTYASRLTTKEAEKMTYGILAEVASSLQGVGYLPECKTSFSIRDWIAKDDNSCLFLTAHATHRALLTPFLSFWLDTAVSGLMGLPEDLNRRVWFVIDELPALQRLSCLPTLLKEGRKFGGCVVAGFQSIADLYNKYGRDDAKVILDCFNTQVFFRCKDPETSKYVSDLIGMSEIIEARESYSYGAHEMRDGTSLNKNRIHKALVLPSELALLPNLMAYLKLPGPYPVTKTEFEYKDMLEVAKAFDFKVDTSIGFAKEEKTVGKDNVVEKNININNCFFDEQFINIGLSDNRVKKLPLKKFSPLLYAKKEDVKQFIISDSGKNINWPNIGFTIHINNILNL